MTLYDNDLVTKDDLLTNIFAKKEDINKYTLAQVTERGLLDINKSAIIMTFKSDLFNTMNVLKDFNIVIITNLITLSKAEMINDYCRKKNIGFIYACQFGFMSFIFTDFGDNFMVLDKNGKKCQEYYIKSISNSCPGIVEIDPIEIVDKDKKKKKILKFETGDYVVFKGVTGMIELNDTPPRPIRVLSKCKFTIEETSRYDQFNGSGIVEEFKMPFPVKFLPLSKAKKFIYFEDINENNDCNNNKIIDEKIFDIEYEEMLDNEIKKQFDDNLAWMNIFNISNKNETLIKTSNSKIHLAMLTLHEYYLINKHLPNSSNKKNLDDCLDISKKIFTQAKNEKEKWVADLNEIDINYLSYIFRYCDYYFIPISKFFGGIVTQEVLKYVGLYKPASQWVYFNFFELLNDNISFFGKNILLNDIKIKEDIEQYMMDDKEKLELLKTINIVLIGFNNIGFEILNLFTRLNLSKNITILDINKNDNYNEIIKLKEIYNFKIIVEDNLNNDISKREWWINSKIIIESLSNKFNSKEKEILIQNAKEYNKILISINADKFIGAFELILPNKLYNKKINWKSLEEIDTPKGDNTKFKQINSHDEVDKYKNIVNLKESLNYSKDIFNDYFNKNIKHLNELIKRSESESDMLKYIDDLMLQDYNIEKILKLIRYLKKLVSLKYAITFESIVLSACEIFQELFQFSIEEILYKYPEDYIALGKHKKFWSGKKYPPKIIMLDINKEEHYQIVYLLTYFYCQIFEFENFEKKMNSIKSIARKYEIKTYDSIIQNKSKIEEFLQREKNSLMTFLTLFGRKNKFEFKEIELNLNDNVDINNFEKMNNHLKFIILTADLILNNYGISSYNNIYKEISLLLKINNILPSTASAMSGLTIFQLFLMFNDPDVVELVSSLEENKNEIKEEKNEIKSDINNNSILFRNFSFNLASNIYLFYNIFKNK